MPTHQLDKARAEALSQAVVGAELSARVQRAEAEAAAVQAASAKQIAADGEAIVDLQRRAAALAADLAASQVTPLSSPYLGPYLAPI